MNQEEAAEYALECRLGKEKIRLQRAEQKLQKDQRELEIRQTFQDLTKPIYDAVIEAQEEKKV